MVALPSSPIRVQGTADGVPTNTETGRQRKSSHGLLALRRSTTTPTTILASAVDLTPHLRLDLAVPSGPDRLCRPDRDLVLVQGIRDLLIKLQMHVQKFGRRQGQPLVQRHIGVITTLEHLEETQGRRAGVLHVMTHREGDVTDVASLIVERSCLTRGSKHAHARLAADVVLPFIGVWMPVQFSHSTRFDLYESGRDILGGQEHT